MAHGLEGRTPLLDPIVADFAFRLPDALKIAAGKGKYLLRRWLAMLCRPPILSARSADLLCPVAEWLRPRARNLRRFLASLGLAEICHPEKVEALFRSFRRSRGKHEGSACWQLLFYALGTPSMSSSARPKAMCSQCWRRND
jgi:asparagine synthase (glutamine-hydrolysing)